MTASWFAGLVTIACMVSGGLASAKDAEDRVYPEGRIRLFKKRYSLFVETGFYRPSAPEARDRFGSLNMRSVGLASRLPFTVLLYRPKDKRGPSLDVSVLWSELRGAGGAEVRVIAPTAGLRAQLVQPQRRIVPFASFRAGPYFGRTSTADNVVYIGANATLGVEICRWAMVSVRYDLVERNSGGLSGRLAVKAF